MKLIKSEKMVFSLLQKSFLNISYDNYKKEIKQLPYPRWMIRKMIIWRV